MLSSVYTSELLSFSAVYTLENAFSAIQDVRSLDPRKPQVFWPTGVTKWSTGITCSPRNLLSYSKASKMHPNALFSHTKSLKNFEEGKAYSPDFFPGGGSTPLSPHFNPSVPSTILHPCTSWLRRCPGLDLSRAKAAVSTPCMPRPRF